VLRDVLRKIEESDRPISCDECDGTMRKTFDQTGTSFILKGDGWFKPSTKDKE
jgi:predicted nucleic acid-binding Zn ribbon protein